ncbi:MAG: hypothetical protein HOV66_07645 [Streptomycetaceae bacterium]|nr:hypothetical protein [Streptomycetaceae bacterium]
MSAHVAVQAQVLTDAEIAAEPTEVWECGPHANAWNGHDARCRRVRHSPAATIEEAGR